MVYYPRKKYNRRPRRYNRPKGPMRKKRITRKRTYRKNTNLTSSAEKKYFDYGFTAINFAQYNDVSTLTNGYLVQEVSLKCDQGLGVNARIGNKVFLTGGIMDMQLATMTSQTNQIKYKYFLVRIPDAYDGPATDIVSTMFDANPFNTGIFDWHSNLDPETASQFKIVAKGQGTLRADNIAAQTSRYQGRKYLKLGFTCKFDNQTTGAPPISNQLRMIIFADTGGVVQGTGITASVNFRMFYLDN